MPAEQRGQPYRIAKGRYGLRYYDRDGKRRRTEQKFPSRSAAFAHFRDVLEPQLRGEQPRLELTLGELAEVYLERHAPAVRPRTIDTLRKRLGYATRAYGAVPLDDLERMSGELADWAAALPDRSRYGIVSALRQTLEAAVRWGYLDRNPAKLAGKNPQPPPRAIRVYGRAELEALAAEVQPAYRPLPAFAAATGLRPEEWGALERRDVDRAGGVLNVRRTISAGAVVELAKTARSRRQVPLSARALEALELLPPRLDTPYLFAAVRGGPCDLANLRRRVWRPAVVASGVAQPARLYDLRSTFASNSLAAGVTVFELARLMGTSAAMIERHYGTLVEGAGADIARRLSAFEAAQNRPTESDNRQG
jgi:integrase